MYIADLFILLPQIMRRQSYILTILLVVVASFSCKKQAQESLIPNVTVNELVYLSNPSSFNLQVQGGWIYNQGGYRGLVVYRRYFTQQYNDFIAYERACPEHFADDCGRMKIVDDIFLECPCTGHQYLLFDGQPMDGSAYPIRFYNTQFDAQSGIISITN